MRQSVPKWIAKIPLSLWMRRRRRRNTGVWRINLLQFNVLTHIWLCERRLFAGLWAYCTSLSRGWEANRCGLISFFSFHIHIHLGISLLRAATIPCNCAPRCIFESNLEGFTACFSLSFSPWMDSPWCLYKYTSTCNIRILLECNYVEIRILIIVYIYMMCLACGYSYFHHH